MTMKNITLTQASLLATLAAATLAPAFALAATQQPSAIITKADAAITARLDSLQKLGTRVGDLRNITQSDVDSITSTLQTNISGLTALKQKIDAETDVATLKTDAASVFGSFRIYALVIPRGWILAAADRVTTINGKMGALATALQTRISAAQASGASVTSLQNALTDLNAKNADALTQAQAAEAAVSSLQPDGGNAAVLASNNTALRNARADIKIASSDLQAARKDAKTIITGLHSIKASNTSATSTSGQ